MILCLSMAETRPNWRSIEAASGKDRFFFADASHLGSGSAGGACVQEVSYGPALCLPPQPLDALPTYVAPSFAQPAECLFRNLENVFADSGSEDALRASQPDPALRTRR